jgi:hypothetical protein
MEYLYEEIVQWLKGAVRLVGEGSSFRNRAFVADFVIDTGAGLARPLVRLWKRWQFRLHLRWTMVRSWWNCKAKKCDYYQVYQAYGPADLTHVGFHAGEQLALTHFLSHPGNPDECRVCKDWAERLRGNLWNTLMERHESEKQYGFHIAVSKKSEES